MSDSNNVIGIGPFVRSRLTVVVERTVARDDRRAHAVLLSPPNEVDRVRSIAHQSVEDRPKNLCAAKPHVLIGLVDDDFHCRQLRQRYRGELLRRVMDGRFEFVEWYGAVDETDVGTSRPESGLPVSAYSLAFVSPSR